ncbi:hypothetical protein B0H11DRAFT_1914943 [Mycena galericulata]|nr:hypothetical protein B0H11DRAFT_1914943 [Mycena galericulata]
MRPLGLQDELEILSAACMGSKRARFDQHPRPALPLFTSLTGGADRAIVPRRPVFGELDKIVDRRHALLLQREAGSEFRCLASGKGDNYHNRIRVRLPTTCCTNRRSTMHIRMRTTSYPSRRTRNLQGFNAVRMISWDLVPFTSNEILRPKVQVLETKDEDFSSAISGLSVITQSPLEAAAHLYRSALRVLSQICRRYQMTVAARRVFTDDDEQHRVRRGHDLLTLTESLTEAIEDERFRIHASDIQTTLRLCADRPSMGESAGTWWTKGRSRTIFKSDIVPPPKEDADPDVDVDVPRGPAQQQPAQDGALGIFVLNTAFSLVIPAVPHLTTISNATRGMASDPASIFADQGHETGRSPHNLRSSLSGTHRDEGIVFRDSTKEQHGREPGRILEWKENRVVGQVARDGHDTARCSQASLPRKVFAPDAQGQRALLGKLQTIVGPEVTNYYIWPLALFGSQAVKPTLKLRLPTLTGLTRANWMRRCRRSPQPSAFSTPRPSIIGPVDPFFNFGSTSPDTESVDLRDVYRYFPEDDESGGEYVKGTEGTEDDYVFESLSRQAAGREESLGPLPPHVRYGRQGKTYGIQARAASRVSGQSIPRGPPHRCITVPWQSHFPRIIDSEGVHNNSASTLGGPCTHAIHEVVPFLVTDPDDFSYRGPSGFLASQSSEYLEEGEED